MLVNRSNLISCYLQCAYFGPSQSSHNERWPRIRDCTAALQKIQALAVQAGKVKAVAVAANGDSPSRAVDAGGGEVRLTACLKAWASAEETMLSLDASFGASLAQKEVCATMLPIPVLKVLAFLHD
jgi:hypothetical protein